MMEFSKFWMHVVGYFCLALSFTGNTVTADMCDKFPIGPCLVNQPTTTVPPVPPAPPQEENAYCVAACAQDNPENYNDICNCTNVLTTPKPITTVLTTTPMESTTTETTIPPTTTPPPVTCYYPSLRPARRSISKRLFSSSPVATECEYPGVVAIFYDNSGTLTPACTASLLEEDLVLINDGCLQFMGSKTLYAMANSYQLSSATMDVSLVSGTEAILDIGGNNLQDLYTIQLSQPLTFNSDCVQPVCVPNVNIPASDIDLTDCRVVGYGDQTKDFGTFASQLMEVPVTVNVGSITKGALTINRVDGLKNTICFNDDSVPLICSHIRTGEWITIGIATDVGYPCNNQLVTKAKVTNLLQERVYQGHYSGLQQFAYADPTVFAP